MSKYSGSINEKNAPSFVPGSVFLLTNYIYVIESTNDYQLQQG